MRRRKGLTSTGRVCSTTRRYGVWGRVKPRTKRQWQDAFSRERNARLREALRDVKVDEDTLALVRKALS